MYFTHEKPRQRFLPTSCWCNCTRLRWGSWVIVWVDTESRRRPHKDAQTEVEGPSDAEGHCEPSALVFARASLLCFWKGARRCDDENAKARKITSFRNTLFSMPDPFLHTCVPSYTFWTALLVVGSDARGIEQTHPSDCVFSDASSVF